MSILSDKKRLVLENAAMRQRWGEGPRLCCDPGKTTYFWEYDLKVEGNVFPIRIVYPDDYPASPPEIICCRPLPPSTPHVWPTARTRLEGQRICWFYPMEQSRTRNVWNAGTDTAAMAVGVAYRWFLAFLVWYSTGTWPVPDATAAT